jgi:hypothetical protein
LERRERKKEKKKIILNQVVKRFEKEKGNAATRDDGRQGLRRKAYLPAS